MCGQPQPGPFAPPSAPLEAPGKATPVSVGRFWGAVFASPVLALIVFGIIRNLIEREADWPSKVLGLLGVFGLLALAIAVTGMVWSSFSPLQARGIHLTWSLSIGTLWAAIFFLGSMVFIRFTDGQWYPLRTRDVLSLLYFWGGFSTYAMLQGVVIRWRLRKLELHGSERVVHEHPA